MNKTSEQLGIKEEGIQGRSKFRIENKNKKFKPNIK